MMTKSGTHEVAALVAVWATRRLSVKRPDQLRVCLSGFVRVALICACFALLPVGAAAQDDLWKAYMEAGTKVLEDAKARNQLNGPAGRESMALAEKRFLLARKEAESFGAQDPRLATTLCQLASLYLDKGEAQERVRQLYQQALAIWAKNPGADPEDTAQQIYELGNQYMDTGQYEDAVILHKRHITLRDQIHEPESGNLVIYVIKLAYAYHHAAKYKDAERTYQRALALAEKWFGKDDAEVAKILLGLADSYYDSAQYKEAHPHYYRAMMIRIKSLGNDDDDTDTALVKYAKNADALHEYESASKIYQQVLTLREKNYGAEDDDVAIAHVYLADVYVKSKDYAAAEAHYKQAYAINEVNFEAGKTVSNLNGDMEKYAALLRLLNREAEAKELEAKTQVLIERVMKKFAADPKKTNP